MRTLGIDLGTSSVKLLVLGGEQPVAHTEGYQGPGTAEQYAACLRGLAAVGTQISLKQLDAVGLSGQTGSYAVLDGRGEEQAAVSWQHPGRMAHLERWLREVPEEEFLAQTGMVHPRVASYPLPSMSLLREALAPGMRLVQPKDALCWKLCGDALTDPYSWRGLAHPSRGAYSAQLLRMAGVHAEQLPRIAARGTVSREAAAASGLREGTPVYVGLNDFYAALLSLGTPDAGIGFDVTGTSEHMGRFVEGPLPARLIRSPFPGGRYVHYGVTGSSGVALAWGNRTFGADEPAVPPRAPLFLPYLRGERAPVFDEEARGMLVGLTDRTDRNTLRYSVLEGVLFSLYSVAQELGWEDVGEIRATGGATASPLLNAMKASLFGVPYAATSMPDGSAIGAAVLAGAQIPQGWRVAEPDRALGDFLRSRYPAWTKLYSAWKALAQSEGTDQLF